jgi:hypothetical protein
MSGMVQEYDVKGCGSCEGFFWDGATNSVDFDLMFLIWKKKEL